jgi:hypothetical protein
MGTIAVVCPGAIPRYRAAVLPRFLVTLVVAVAGCTPVEAARPPATATPVQVASAEPQGARPPATAPSSKSPVRGQAGLRLAMDGGGALFVDGQPLSVGDAEQRARAILGAPTWSKAYPVDRTAMSDTTYLHYTERGITLRTKHGVVEGYYLYFAPTELEGHRAQAAHPLLPADLPLDASVEQVVQALGEPTRRAPFELMKWLDLDYLVGTSLIAFHYEDGKLFSAKLELASVKGP